MIILQRLQDSIFFLCFVPTRYISYFSFELAKRQQPALSSPWCFHMQHYDEYLQRPGQRGLALMYGIMTFSVCLTRHTFIMTMTQVNNCMSIINKKEKPLLKTIKTTYSA